MHGLINKAIEIFVLETYGVGIWQRVVDDAGLGFQEFEAMLSYEPALTKRTLDAIAKATDRPHDHTLEDLGTFLVTSPGLPALRRLLRFGGVTYVDFLHSLDELPDRVRLAVDDLKLPNLTLIEKGSGHFRLRCAAGLQGYGHVMVGVLRAMADDYGTLAMLDHGGTDKDGEMILISIVENAFAEGKSFALSARRA